MCYIYPNADPVGKISPGQMPRKLRAKLERTEIPDQPTHVDAQEELLRMLSEEFAKAMDKEILEGIFQMNFDENVALLERMYPGQNPHDALRGIGLGDIDLKKEHSLLQKIRSARIDSITD